jgi:hypothetical protein
MGDVRALVEVVARALADDPSQVTVTEGEHRGIGVVEVSAWWRSSWRRASWGG